MTTTDCTANVEELIDKEDLTPGPPVSAKRASKVLKGLLYGFAATVTVGLGLTIWYLGVRMVAASAAAHPNVAQPRAAASSVKPAFYLELPTLGSKQDADLVRSLEVRGFRAESKDARIRIGPFATTIDLQQAQRKLEADGVLALETGH